MLVLLVNFFYHGAIEGSSDDIVTLSKYAKELHVKGIVNSGNNARPLKLELLESKSKVKEQLQKLQQSNDSDSGSSSSEEDDLQVVYEKKCDVNQAARTESTNNKTVAPSNKSKRAISPTLVTTTTTQEKKIKVVLERKASTSEGGIIMELTIYIISINVLIIANNLYIYSTCGGNV